MQILKLKFLLILLLCAPLCLAQMPTRDNQIKAACVYNFSSFVGWPANAFASSKAPLVIGVVGKNPFGDYLKELTAGESVGDHPIVIKQFASANDIGECHILYISISDKKAIKTIIQKMSGRKVLTVSDAPGFAEMGGMIRLFNANDKVNIQINTDATKDEGLTVSTKLLKLAKIYKRD